MRIDRFIFIVLLSAMPATAIAAPELAVAIAGMLAAEEECSGIAVDHGLIDRVIAGEAAKDARFEQCARDGCRKGAVAKLKAMPTDQKAQACAAWRKVIGDAVYLVRH